MKISNKYCKQQYQCTKLLQIRENICFYLWWNWEKTQEVLTQTEDTNDNILLPIRNSVFIISFVHGFTEDRVKQNQTFMLHKYYHMHHDQVMS